MPGRWVNSLQQPYEIGYHLVVPIANGKFEQVTGPTQGLSRDPKPAFFNSLLKSSQNTA